MEPISTPSQMTPAAKILKNARSYASKKGYSFRPGADQYFTQHADNAGREIDRLASGDRPAKLKEANGNFAHLIDEMITASKTIPGYGSTHPGSIGEQTISKALSALCPIWPFC